MKLKLLLFSVVINFFLTSCSSLENTAVERDEYSNTYNYSEISNNYLGTYSKDLCCPTDKHSGLAICNTYKLNIKRESVDLNVDGHMIQQTFEFQISNHGKNSYRLSLKDGKEIGLVTIKNNKVFLKYKDFLKCSEEPSGYYGYVFSRED